MKVLIYGDPHVNKYPQGLVDQRRSTEVNMFKEIYHKIVKEEAIELCICLGDFLHNSYLPASDMDYIESILSCITTDTVILTGNHDRSTPIDSAISLFGRLNSHIYTVRGIYEYRDPEENLHLFVANGYLDRVAKNVLKSAKYLYTHEDYKGVVMNESGYISKTGHQVTSIDIGDDLTIFNGHIHHPFIQNGPNYRLIDIGAVSPVAFGELDVFKYPTLCILDTETGDIKATTISSPILPVTCTPSQYNELRKFYSLCLDHVRLRVTYTDDIPELEGTDEFLSVEYKKLLSDSIDSETDISTEVEDIIVNVPDYIDEYLESDKNLSTDDKVQVKSMCDQILAKI